MPRSLNCSVQMEVLHQDTCGSWIGYSFWFPWNPRLKRDVPSPSTGSHNLCYHPQMHRGSDLKPNKDIGASLPVDTAARVGGHNPVQLNSKPRSHLSPHWRSWLAADTLVLAPALRLAIAHFYPSMVRLP